MFIRSQFSDLSMIRELTRNPLFSRLSEAQLKRISARAARIELAGRQALFRQGDRATRFYLLTKGQIKLYRLAPTGTEKVIELIAAGQTFGEALMFLDRPHYPVSAVALDRSELISVDAADFAATLRESVDSCFLILGDLSQRLHQLVQEVAELSLRSAACRVAAFLLGESDPQGLAELRAPKQVLASRLSVTPETFSRILNTLKADGTIAMDGRRIRILDPVAMSEAAEACALPCPRKPDSDHRS